MTKREAKYEIEKVIDAKIEQKGKKWELKYKLRYKGYTDKEDLWEVYSVKNKTWEETDIKLLPAYSPKLFDAAQRNNLHQYAEVNPDEVQLNPKITQELFQRWGTPEIDLFATSCNRQVNKSISRKSQVNLDNHYAVEKLARV
jgi:hypothetical protein